MRSAVSRLTPLLVACFLIAMPRAAFATMWLEPTFIEMVKKADLIAIIRVEDGGATASRVRAVQVIKGSAPKGDFVLHGYNHVFQGEPSRPDQWMRTGERYLAFVRRDDDPPESRWTHLPHYRVPTPTTGDLPVRNGKVHGSWAYPSDPQAAAGVPLPIVLPLLKALLDPQDAAAMAEARRVLSAELTVDLARRGAGTAPPPEVAAKLDWLLSAQAEYGQQVGTAQAVLHATRSHDPVLQLAAIRALRSLEPTDEVFARIEELLAVRGHGTETFVQAEAARVLVALDSKGSRALPMLVRALPGSDPRDGHNLKVDRIRHAYESGREVMIRALAEYGGKEAVQAVLTVMSEPAPPEGVLGAFVAFLRAHPSDGLRAAALSLYATAPDLALHDFHGAIAEIGDEALLDEMLARFNQHADLYDFAQGLEAYALRAEPGDPRLTEIVIRVLKERTGEDLREFVAMTIPLRSEEAHRLAAAIDPSTLGDGGAETIQIAREARALQARGHRDPRESMRAWFKLLEKDAPVGFSTDYLYRELVCSTPSTLDAELVSRLSQETDRSDERDAVLAALRAGGRAARDGSIAHFRCPGFAPTKTNPARHTPSAHAASSASRTTAAMTGAAGRHPRAGCGAGCAARGGQSSGTSFTLLVMLALALRR